MLEWWNFSWNGEISTIFCHNSYHAVTTDLRWEGREGESVWNLAGQDVRPTWLWRLCPALLQLLDPPSSQLDLASCLLATNTSQLFLLVMLLSLIESVSPVEVKLLVTTHAFLERSFFDQPSYPLQSFLLLFVSFASAPIMSCPGCMTVCLWVPDRYFVHSFKNHDCPFSQVLCCRGHNNKKKKVRPVRRGSKHLVMILESKLLWWGSQAQGDMGTHDCDA